MEPVENTRELNDKLNEITKEENKNNSEKSIDKTKEVNRKDISII